MENIKKVDILAIGAHPDDIELGCAGTIAKHISLGLSVGVVDLTRGELGTRGDEFTRKKEAIRSAEILGLSFRENLGMKDGFFEVNEENILKLVRVIRSCQPDIVLANSIRDRHPDHAVGAELARKACFLAGLSKVVSYDDNGVEQQKIRPRTVFHYIQDLNLEPDIVVNIDGFWETKKAAVLAFETQFYNPNFEAEQSPISGLDFLQFLEGKARGFGRHIGSEFGEGFTSEKYIGVENLIDVR